MTDRLIPFKAPMVRALLDGRKSMTRRLLRNPEYFGCPTGDCPHDKQAECNAAMAALTAKDVGFAIGDRLWVREHWRTSVGNNGVAPRDLDPITPVLYLADGGQRPGYAVGVPGRHRHGMHMPRWASRITLIVTDVRIEQLQDISEADAMAEGISQSGRFFGLPETDWDDAELSASAAFKRLWNSINGSEAWDANPWVVAIGFDVINANIDRIADAIGRGVEIGGAK